MKSKASAELRRLGEQMDAHGRRHYILDENRPVRVSYAQYIEWGMANGQLFAHVAHDRIGPLLVSTIFLGTDHSHAATGPPLLFETMIRGPGADDYQRRCSTWEEAEAQHAEALADAHRILA